MKRGSKMEGMRCEVVSGRCSSLPSIHIYLFKIMDLKLFQVVHSYHKRYFNNTETRWSGRTLDFTSFLGIRVNWFVSFNLCDTVIYQVTIVSPAIEGLPS
jgi:hypothetical protein